MEINVKLVNVEDADAIIVTLQKEDKNFVLLIDGGRAHHFDKVKKEIDSALSNCKRDTIDLVVCTHYDEDHIGGLLHLFDKYPKITTLWTFNTKQLQVLSEQDFRESESILPSERDVNVGSSMDTQKNDHFSGLITSVLQEKKLLEKAVNRDLVPIEPIAGVGPIPGWEEIEVLGPTQKYYDELFPKDLKTDEIKEDFVVMSEENIEENDGKDPCLEFSKNRTRVSKVNLNSAIILITVENRKYLFAADAGLESFYAIPNYEKSLSNIYWLKVPHHGSKNNLDTKLIELMRPKIAAISGNKYISKNLVKCLELHETTVYSTRDHGDLTFRNGKFEASG